LERDDRKQKSSHTDSSLVDKLVEIAKLSQLRQKLGLVDGISKEDAEVLISSEGTTWDLFRSSLSKAKTLTSSWGGSLYFVYLPSWDRFGKGLRGAEIEHANVMQVVSGLGIPTIDILPAFQAHKDPLSLFPLRVFGHYNELGNKIVGENVLKFLSTPKQKVSLQP
jgi:hypothetical protein